VEKQDGWKNLLKADPTDWLLEEDDADPESTGVRYLALRDVVEAGEREIKTARTKAHREGPIARILAKMDPEGYWVKPGPGYLPKFKSGVWSIISLAQMGGYIGEDKRIDTACKYLLDHALTKGGQFSIRRPTDIGLCWQGNMLASLLELGYEDKRLDTAFEWTARRVTGEGLPHKINDDGLAPAEGVPGPFRYIKFITDPLFGCRTNKGLACAWAGVNVLMAFSRLPTERRTGITRRAIEAGSDFFLNVDTAAAGFPGHRKGTPDPRWWQFGFPAFGGDILRIAEAFTSLGYGSDPRLDKTLEVIQSKQGKDGRWLFEYPNSLKYKMWVKYGESGKPNKWVTLRAMRVLKRAGEQIPK
jgi:hypothetical protein